jgi:hypothetical protein
VSLISLADFAYCREALELDDRDQPAIELLIFSCSAEIESYTGRNLLQRSLVEYRNGFLNPSMALRQYPVSELTELRCNRGDEEFVVNPELFTLDNPALQNCTEQPARIRLNEDYLFPRGRNNIHITYTAGYAADDMPAPLKMALAEMVGWSLKRMRARQIGMSGLTNSKRAKEWPVTDKTMPDHVKDLLEPYRRKGW